MKQKQYTRASKFQTTTKFCMQNSKVGEDDIFLNKNVFISLVTYKISIKYHYITSKTQRVQYESSTMWPGS
jgi:hypothetical protein